MKASFYAQHTDKKPTPQFLTLVTVAAVGFFTSAMAAPVETTANGTGDGVNTPVAVVAANYGTPHCNSNLMLAFCTADNAHAYCDATGFHNNFMAQCKRPNCWCA
ncbi:hypothetical protein N658DRAFT_487507 [Parathielavia hyrcaniae]|uniref:Uncharacterized protein n=1 Tax=Parathielavia hyrcaniae TaxID=113614 RepID=A0AAN6T0L8_9PEZI|nr:hypothetical protein N658DRAFT_487507 [Parathielavia hyrcaniae]